MKNKKMVEAEKLTLAPGLLNKDQIAVLLKPTPALHIYQRPARGGGNWSYVTGVHCKKMLNFVFGWNWDFEVMQTDFFEDKKQIVVLGKLTVRSNGHTVIRMQYGRADVKYKKVGGPLDIGNDMKAATTDALKKCASELGFFSDVYAPNEYREIGIISSDEQKDREEVLDMVRAALQQCNTTEEVRNYMAANPHFREESEIMELCQNAITELQLLGGSDK